MKLNPRRLVLLAVLAAFLTVTISPGVLDAQNTQTQTQSTSSKSKKKKRAKKSKEQGSAAEANATAATTSTPKARKSRKRKGEVEPAASTPGVTTPTESHAAPARSERSHATTASSVRAQTPPSPGMVWVNTDTGVYHKSGSRWYGKTKQGKWMNEAEAQSAGYKPAKHEK